MSCARNPDVCGANHDEEGTAVHRLNTPHLPRPRCLGRAEEGGYHYRPRESQHSRSALLVRQTQPLAPMSWV